MFENSKNYGRYEYVISVGEGTLYMYGIDHIASIARRVELAAKLFDDASAVSLDVRPATPECVTGEYVAVTINQVNQ